MILVRPYSETDMGKWDDYWTLGVPVDLEAGSNKVTFGNASAWAPNIDRIELGRVIG